MQSCTHACGIGAALSARRNCFDFALTGSVVVCNALMISCPVMSVGEFSRSFSPNLGRE